MLVVATSIPDAREWAQWRGRTARQDRPGQYLVVLSAEDEPFASEPGLAEARGHPNPSPSPDYSSNPDPNPNPPTPQPPNPNPPTPTLTLTLALTLIRR
jgi:hypothetical protein